MSEYSIRRCMYLRVFKTISVKKDAKKFNDFFLLLKLLEHFNKKSLKKKCLALLIYITRLRK